MKLVYKAAISQQTGEVGGQSNILPYPPVRSLSLLFSFPKDWKDTPIFLETALPTFGLDTPSLGIWALSHTKSTPDPRSASVTRGQSRAEADGRPERDVHLAAHGHRLL